MKLWKESGEAWREIRPGVFNRVLYEEKFGLVFLVRFKKGASYPSHNGAVDHLGILVRGEGIFDVGTRKTSFREGDSYFIKPEDDHGFTNTSNGESIMSEFFVPPREDSSKISQKPEPI